MLRFNLKKGGILISLFFFFVSLSVVSQKAEAQFSPKISHSIQVGNSTISTPSTSAIGTYNIVAVMVDFLPDSNRFTSGDGTFYLDYLDKEEIIIDPLPHNRAYFESHLEFAKNYFETVSNEQIQFQYQVIPQVVTVSKTMDAYAPLGEDNSELFKLQDFVREVWTTVGQRGDLDSYTGDPSRTAFIIFHAGAGRDIELLGTTLDKTPQDIPSLTFNSNSISSLFPEATNGGLNFTGIPFPITNTLILPATESRQGDNIDETKFVIQLSTNGLICASLGSFLGLPDLFNTEDGQSAIGQFGLMDGAGFFAYSGLFPPEPSAWEKQYLGWSDPIVANTSSEQSFNLDYVSSRPANQAIKIPVNDAEYFLVENRHRDPNGAGVTLTIRTLESGDQQITFTNQDEYFRFFDTDSLQIVGYPKGVVVHVSNYDWALPGGLDYGEDNRRGNEDDRLLNGGILIWHIDEAVIKNGIVANTVNNDPTFRGVDLEEADGAQDIGLPNSVTELSGIQNGSPFDFWWSGNDSRVILPSGSEIQLYQNRFGDDTEPSNQTNTGLSTGFELFGFSDNQPQASFSVRPSEQVNSSRVLNVQVFDFESDYNSYHGLSSLVIESDTLIIVPTQMGVFSVSISSTSPDIQKIDFESPVAPFLLSDGLILASSQTTAMQRLKYEAGEWSLVWSNNSAIAFSPYQPMMQIELNSIYSPQNGMFISIETGNSVDRNFPYGTGSALSDRHSDQLVLSGFEFVEIESGRSIGHIISQPTYGIGLAINQDASYRYLLFETNYALWLEPEADRFSNINTSTRIAGMNLPTMIDANRDGKVDVIINGGRQQLIFNQSGGEISDSRILLPEGSEFASKVLVYKTNSDDLRWIGLIKDRFRYKVASGLLIGEDSNIQVIDDAFTFLDGEPLPLTPAIVGNRFYVMSREGRLIAWKIPDFESAVVSGIRGDVYANSFQYSATDQISTPGFESLLDQEETYNWPNPTDERTFLRFQTSEPASIEIVVHSMSGNIVRTIQTTSRGQGPEEIPLQTSQLGSGVYLARVTATSVSSGKTDSKIIRIAVIH